MEAAPPTSTSPGPTPAGLPDPLAPLPPPGPQDPPVPAPGPPRPPRLPWHPVWRVLGAAMALTVLAVVAGALVRAPYIVYAPGSAIPTGPAITVPDDRSHTAEGEILFLTVSLRGTSRQVSFVEAAYGWIRTDQDVFPRRLILGNQTGEESRQRSLELMRGSQVLAAKVALEHLGYEVPTTGEGAVVNTVRDDVPAAAVLDAGDVIVAADGQPVAVDDDLRAVLAEKQPGDTVALELHRGAALAHGGDAAEPTVETVEVEMVANPDPSSQDAPRALIGITTFTFALDYELPFPVEIDTADVGGPSAGLALTLGILDRLTPGDLTGGKDVAVTGEISPDGTVELVGGVAQKASAARAAGADLILVPAPEAAEARAHAGGVPVVGVATLDDALRALADVGGNALDLPRGS